MKRSKAEEARLEAARLNAKGRYRNNRNSRKERGHGLAR